MHVPAEIAPIVKHADLVAKSRWKELHVFLTFDTDVVGVLKAEVL